eukprot:TRINITY_DN10533_c0_g1_i1.p1 TRINITY_DN10533_c0_g1~~TRINITY_DN10533_c0_g1_i1.p1  ORF type:complete len:141 (+),score=38.81 TRINITY_DN10533_c0_g1_i1:102-524(+)
MSAQHDEYLGFQIQFLRAIQTKDMPAAFEISEQIEKRWPDHENVKLFRETVEGMAKKLETMRSSGLLKTENEGDDDDTESSESDAEENLDEEQKKITRDFNTEMDEKMELWEKQLASGDVDAMRQELIDLQILRSGSKPT